MINGFNTPVFSASEHWDVINWGEGITATVSGDTLTLTSDGARTMNDFSYSENSRKLTEEGIKHVIIENGVTNIGDNAFSYNLIKTVQIPDSVTSIGRDAFYGNSLSFLEIPEGVSIIDNHAFGYNQLVSIAIPGSVSTIGSGAFYSNKLTSIEISEGVSVMGDYAFYNNLLTSVDIPSSMTDIGARAFSNNRLNSVVIPDNVTNIGLEAFEGILESQIVLGSGFSNYLLFSDSMLLGHVGTADGDLVIPDGVTGIQDYAFRGSQLTSVIIPDSVTYIGKGAFQGLEESQISLGSGFTSFLLFNESTLLGHIGTAEGELVVPDGVTAIANSAFSNNKLTSVVLPDGFTSLGQWSFAGNQISSIVFPDSLTTITWGAFSSNNINEINIPETIQKIEFKAFWDNPMESVQVPDSVVEIGNKAFPCLEENIILGAGYSEYFIIDGTVLKGHIGKQSDGILTIPDGITEIEEWAFEAKELTELNIPQSVVKIGTAAFMDNKLTELNFPDNLAVIEHTSFSRNMLTEVFIPDTVHTIGSAAFSGNNIFGFRLSNNIDIVYGSNKNSLGNYDEILFEKYRLAGKIAGEYSIYYNVRFLDYDGTVIKTNQVIHGQSAVPPVAPVRSGYTFNNWSGDFTEVTSNIDIVAQYSLITPTPSPNPAPTPAPALPSTPVNIVLPLISENGILVEESVVDAILKIKDEEVFEVKIPDDLKSLLIPKEVINLLLDSNIKLDVEGKGVKYSLPISFFKDNSEIELIMNELSAEEHAKYESLINSTGAKMLTNPITFEIYVDNKIVTSFGSYVPRTFELPSSYDPSDGITGVVFNEDGTFRTVPTYVFNEDGVYFARVNSLSNSTYALISMNISISSVDGRWSEKIVNDMASKMILTNINSFTPTKGMRRLDFAIYIKNALGLSDSTQVSTFTDVQSNMDLNSTIMALVEKGIVNGYPDGSFKPEKLISREEMAAMIINAKAYLDFTDLQTSRITKFSDVSQISNWAYGMKELVNYGIYNGYEDKTLRPQDTITHEEGLAVISNVLKNTGLSN